MSCLTRGSCRRVRSFAIHTSAKHGNHPSQDTLLDNLGGPAEEDLPHGKIVGVIKVRARALPCVRAHARA